MSALVDLLSWLEGPSAERAIHFSRDEGRWEPWSYEHLAELTFGASALLVDAGVRAGDVVVLLFDSEPSFVAGFFGALLAGATPCPLAPPGYVARGDDPAAHMRQTIDVARPAAALTSAGYASHLAAAAADNKFALIVLGEDDRQSEAPRRPRASLSLLQFTSGSSSIPRGVRIGTAALEANIASITHRLGLAPGDAGVSWLPVHHDMGLIGCLLTPVRAQLDLWLMRPEQFIRRPERWLRCLGDGRATGTAAPTFGFRYATQRVADHELDGLDFTSWRLAFVGAERVDCDALDAFARRLEPFGFRRATFTPAYGLAEATLAVTVGQVDDEPRVAAVDATATALGEEIAMCATPAAMSSTASSGRVHVVACGRPVEGATVSICDEDGHAIADGTLGEIVVRGPSIADGYAGDNVEGPTRFAGDRLLTGDAGFVIEGQLYVLGRIGESIQVRGANVFVEDLENSIAGIRETRPGRATILAGADLADQLVTVVVEATPGPWVEEVERAIARALDETCLLQIACGSPGAILRTTSGKPRRRAMWNALRHGSLAVDVVSEARPGTRPAARVARVTGYEHDRENSRTSTASKKSTRPTSS